MGEAQKKKKKFWGWKESLRHKALFGNEVYKSYTLATPFWHSFHVIWTNKYLSKVKVITKISEALPEFCMVNTECEGFILCNVFSVFSCCHCLFPLAANVNNHPNLQGPLMRCLQPLLQLRAQPIAQIGYSTRYIRKPKKPVWKMLKPRRLVGWNTLLCSSSSVCVCWWLSWQPAWGLVLLSV